MNDLKDFIIKLIISVIVLAIAFTFFEKKPAVNAIQFPVRKQETTPPSPSQLQWHDHFKGIENLPSKPKVQPKESN